MDSDVSFLYDIPVELVVELGRTRLTVGHLAALGKEDVVPLDRMVGQALDVMVGGQLFGQGEVVIDEDRLALRILSVKRKSA